MQKKVTIIPDVFPIIRTPKNVVKQISKESRFRGPFEKQHVKGDQILLKSERHHLYNIYWSLWRQNNSQKYLLLICKLLRLFLNTFTANDKYCLLSRDNLRHPIQMHVSHMQKTFSQFPSTFLKVRLNFEPFQEKVDPHSWSICENTDSEIRR